MSESGEWRQHGRSNYSQCLNFDRTFFMFSRQNVQPMCQVRTTTTYEMSKVPLIFLHFFILLIITLPSQVISQTPNEETTLLLTFKRQLGNPPSLQSWQSSPSSPCDWPEVNCTGGAATELHLDSKDITVHNLPAATICGGGLKSLRHIDLSNNSISGEFPTALYNCSSLQYLDLSQNYLSGKIPGDINRLRTVTFLNLAGNSFTGDVPPAIGNLPELRTLSLHQNNFNGSFPKEIGNLSNLEFLKLAYNYRLAPAPIPVEFGNMKSLKFMWIKNCNIIGEIPESFGNLVSLEQLDLSMNNLTGRIPSTLLSLRNLQSLYLFHNRLSGEIPSSVQALNLTDVDLSMNNLTGSIPQDFGKLENLTVLLLYYNQLSGEIPRGLGLIPMLKTFRAFGNMLNGTLPPELGLHSKLLYVEVSSNQLSGGLPEHLCDGGALKGLIVFSNNLSGELPQWLGNCSSLVSVQLYNNRFSGEVPSGLWTLKNLETLMLSNNSFTGQIPSKLSWNMSRLEIRDNKFSGNISLGVSSDVNLVVFDARNNMLSGEISRGLTGLSRINTLLLDGNRLSGALPSEIISWQSLNALSFSRNNLSGQIPLAMCSLPNLNYLDLSENDLSGEIPTQLANLKLPFLNLSSNNLSGNIPDEFNNLAYENSFLNNPNLCAHDPKFNLSSCLTKTPPRSTHSSKFLALILVLAIIALLVTASFALCKLKKHWGKKRCGHNKLSTWRLTSFQRFDLTEINLFSSLTDSNLIGSGGFGKVYRIASNRQGKYVAVKKIYNDKDFDDKLEKEFMAEVEILGSIRHSNIVKLLCCYSSENSKLLVYEYMENHSLDKWLHGKKQKPALGLSSPNKNHVALSWPTRLEIAIGAAQGLCYMHHECSPPIIHRDVKSSNILLDSEFRASIADFGLAKVLVKPGELHTMSALAGSFGYIAPEYAYSTKINEKVDVYSFGVVLLELVTGREAKNGGEHASSLVDWAWQHYSEGKSLGDALDEDIKATCHVEEMTKVFKLGLICTSTLPSARPTTREILQVLRQCCHPASSRKRVASEFDFTPLLGDARYISSYKDSNAVSENDESSLYSV